MMLTAIAALPALTMGWLSHMCRGGKPHLPRGKRLDSIVPRLMGDLGTASFYPGLTGTVLA